MRVGRRSVVIAFIMLSAVAPGGALAQPAPAAKPAATAKAAAAGSSAPRAQATKPPKVDAAKASKTAPDAGAAEPPAAGIEDDAEGGELPPGHPDTDELPTGHPAVGANPHGGSQRQGQQMSGLFEAPDDTVQDDASLPPGVIVVAIQDANGKPVPGASIELTTLRSSVSKGDSRERVSKQADEQGTFRFEGMPIGTGTTYGVSVSRQGATFSMPPFPLGAEAGKRAVLHVYDVTSDLNSLPLGMQGIVYLQLKQDAIAIEQLFQVFNLGRSAWTPDVTFALPQGYKAFNKPDSLEEMRFDEVNGTGVALRGTVSPGRHEVNFRYQVPLDEEERQTIRIELPPRMAQVRVMAEASKAMTLDVAGFPTSQRTQGRDGKKLIVTEKQASRAEGGVRTLEITLGGLPTPSVSRWIALGLAGVTVVGAAVYAFLRRDEADLDDDARQELLEARNALLEEFVELERARKRGDIGPKTYSRVRNALLDALARIVGMIEAAPAAEKDAGSGRSGGSLKPRAAAAPRL
jgi:hypothetical protein